jgi:WD40 repeat protein
MGRQRCAVWRCGILVVILVSQAAAAALAVEPLRLQPMPLAIEPGTPLSTRSIVTHPPVLRGALSWTIESRNHRGYTYAMALSPDGQQMVTGGVDGTLRIWNLATGELVRVMIGHDYYVLSVAWSPCGNVIASAGSYDGTARLWDAKTGQPLRVFKKLKSPVRQVAWSSDGTRLMIGGGDSGSLYLWNAAGDLVTDFMEVGRPVYMISWSPDGKRLALCVNEQPVNVLDVGTTKAIFSCGLATDAYTHVAWASDSNMLAAGSSTETSIWTLGTEEPPVKIAGISSSVAFSPDGKLLAVGNSAVLTICDRATGKALGTQNFPATRVAWHAQTGQLVATSFSGRAAWKLVAGKLTEAFRKDAGGLAPPVWTSGRPVVTGIGTTKLHVWDPVTAKLQQTLAGHAAAVSSVAWSRDGRSLASAAGDMTIRLWDAKNGEVIETLKGHKSTVSSIAWSPDGRTLASGSYDKTVRLWDAEGQPKATLEGHNGAVLTVAWTPTGNYLASGSTDETAILWSPSSKQKVRMLRASRGVYSIAMTTLGKIFAVALGTGDNLSIYNGSTGELYPDFRLGGRNYCYAVCWMPTGPYLISGREHTTQLWDLAANKSLHSLGAMAPVRYVAHAANGAVVLSGNDDRTVRFWDAAKGQLRGVILAEPDYVVYLTTDGQWKVDPQKEVDLVYVVQTDREQVTLTPDEFATRFRWKNNPAKVKMVTR